MTKRYKAMQSFWASLLLLTALGLVAGCGSHQDTDQSAPSASPAQSQAYIQQQAAKSQAQFQAQQAAKARAAH